MKTIFTTLTMLILVYGGTSAQSIFTKEITELKSDSLYIDTHYANTTIKTWNNNYISITADVSINMGTANENFNIAIDNDHDATKIITTVEIENIESVVVAYTHEDKKIMIPREEWENDTSWKAHKYKQISKGPDVDIKLVILIPEHMTVVAESYYGGHHIEGTYRRLDAHSRYDLIEADLSSVHNMKSISLVSDYDLVDLAIDKNIGATVDILNGYGTIYSDLTLVPLNVKKVENLTCLNINSGIYQLNNGGIPVKLSANYGCIYIRQKG